jgi:hypothetical protein
MKPATSRRAHPRHEVPSMVGAVRVELVLPKAHHNGTLWDVAREGTCVLIHGDPGLHLGQGLELRFRHDVVIEPIVLQAELLWQKLTGVNTFAGFRFVAGPLPEGTFLDDYMRMNWADH